MLTIVLRYHPVFKHALCKALQLVPFPRIYGVTIRPAWSNALPSVAGSIESSNLKLCQRVFGEEGAACVHLTNTSAASRHRFTFEQLLSRFHA